MSKMFFIFLACVMVLGIGVSSYGNELSPSATTAAEKINNSVSSLNYDSTNETITFKNHSGNPYTNPSR